MKKMIPYFFIFAGLLVLQACGNQAPEITQTAPSAENIPAAPDAIPQAVLGEGVIKGKILFSGTAPERAALDMGADPTCSTGNASPVLSEDLVVAAEGGIQHAFVYVKQGIQGVYPAPAEKVVLDQRGCKYTPHVFGIQTGQTLEILNSDPTLHNVHGMPQKSKEFNLGMPIQGMKLNRKFDAPEVMAKFKCDVHPWMSAYAGIMEHPFYAVTKEDGSFQIKGLPAGKYTLEVWQEKLGIKNLEVDVPASGEAPVELTYSAS